MCYSIDYSGYDVGEEEIEVSSSILLLDNNFKKIADLVTLTDDYIDGINVFLTINEVRCVDIDEDGIMEIIMEIPIWEGRKISIIKYNGNKLEGEINIEAGIRP